LKEATINSTTYEDFIENLANEYLVEIGKTIEDESISLETDMTKEDDVYTLTADCTLTNLETESMGNDVLASGDARYTLKFTENGLVEFVYDIDLVMTMEQLDTALGGSGEGKIVLDLKMDEQEKVVVTETFDSSKIRNDLSSLQGIDHSNIQNALVNINYVDKDGFNVAFGAVDYLEGLQTEDLVVEINGINLSEVTWYTDEARTQEFENIASFKSFDEIKLYTKDTITVPNTHATIKTIMTTDEVEKRVEYRDLTIADNDVFSLSGYSGFDFELTVDGVETPIVGNSFTLEAGKVYIVEITASWL